MKSSGAKSGKSSGARPPSGDPVFGRNLELARNGKGWSQERLAAAVKVTKGAISQYETGTTSPSIPTLIQLAGALGRSVDGLLFGNGRAVTAGQVQAVLPGQALDDRIAALPEALQEYVIQQLRLAEAAKDKVPDEFVAPPTSENLARFHAYLAQLTMPAEPKDPDETP